MNAEQKVHAVGHYSQLLAFWVILAFFIYIGVMNELHPAPLLEGCKAVGVK